MSMVRLVLGNYSGAALEGGGGCGGCCQVVRKILNPDRQIAFVVGKT